MSAEDQHNQINHNYVYASLELLQWCCFCKSADSNCHKVYVYVCTMSVADRAVIVLFSFVHC